MMDDGLDDLFGDAPPLQIPPPLPKGLLQTIDDLRLSGCCQYVRRSSFGPYVELTVHLGRLPGLNLAVLRMWLQMVTV